jgi:hypothetical protein
VQKKNQNHKGFLDIDRLLDDFLNARLRQSPAAWRKGRTNDEAET